MWRVEAEIGHPKVQIRSPEGLFRFEILRGCLTRPLLTALKAIEHPVLRPRVPAGFTVSSPRTFGVLDNSGDNRRIVILQEPRKAPLVLRLLYRNDRLTEPFLRGVRDALVRKVDPGTTHEEFIEKAREGGRKGARRADPENRSRAALAYHAKKREKARRRAESLRNRRKPRNKEPQP